MSTASKEIQALTATQFTTPEKFLKFCHNDGKPHGGIINGQSVLGSMNATFETIDPGSLETLATVCEMGQDEVDAAVTAGQQAFHGNGVNGWRDIPVEEKS